MVKFTGRAALGNTTASYLTNSMLTPDLRMMQRELQQELKDILAYWQRYAPDPRGGFYGEVDYENRPKPDAPKGVVLNSRILWTFSAAARHTGHDDQYLPTADRAFAYLNNHFRDRQHGGVYWSVRPDGSPLVTTKQLYGQAFALYGLSEYYRATHNADALTFAQAIYDAMVTHSFDARRGGFREAFARDWSPADDYILSKRANAETKTMNTHLHMLEAFTAFQKARTNEGVRRQIRGLLDVFLDHIIDRETYRMNLFMDDDWRVRHTAISYGHDIEASWLLVEAADALHDDALLRRVKDVAVKMARAARTGLQPDGGMTYEFDPKTGHRNDERSWWVMAEAMVGFMNAYQLTGERPFLEQSQQSWAFIKKHLLDTRRGEWFMGVGPDHRVTGNAKISMWKCPYHNARACLEMIDRLG